MKQTLSENADKKIVVTRDIINELRPIEFDGPIYVVNNEETAEYAFNRLKGAKCVGFDTESRPAFLKGQKFPVSIVQISLEDEAFIFQLKTYNLSNELVSILADDSVTKVGIGVKDDIKKLQDIKQFEPSNFVDLSDVAKSHNIKQSGARALTALFMGRRLIKSSQKTNWAKVDLTERQLRYAATDAWICLQIMPKLERSEYAIPLTYSEE